MIEIHEIAKMVEEIEIGETVGMEDPITEMIDVITEIGETVMIEIEVEDIVETIIVETGDLVRRIAMDHGVQEVLQEGEIIVDMTGTDMIDIEDGLVKASEGKKKDTTIEIVVRRVATRDLSLPESG